MIATLQHLFIAGGAGALVLVAAFPVAAFWAGLSGPQRWWLVAHQSAMVGGRDGIAVANPGSVV